MRHVRWKHEKTADRFTHFLCVLSQEYTLCGNAFDGLADEHDQDLVVTEKRVTCPACILVVSKCQEVKKSEMRG